MMGSGLVEDVYATLLDKYKYHSFSATQCPLLVDDLDDAYRTNIGLYSLPA
jgi:hypothetical protein